MTLSLTRERVRSRPHDPATDRRLAGVHLRMGLFGLARAELEALAGTADLDQRGLLFLAEARWRTGDLTGAGEAAQAYLGTGGEDVLALIIAAEATAAVGRPAEARRLVARVEQRGNVPLDQIFAGIRPSAIWPDEAASSRIALEETAAWPLGIPPGARAGVEAAVGPEGTADERAAELRAAELRAAEEAAEREAAESPALNPATGTEDGFWELETVRGVSTPEPREELTSARTEMAVGNVAAAAIHLAVALRIRPDLATDVLDLVDSIDASTAQTELVRGDALRLLGREDEARRAYAAAAELIANPATQAAEAPGIHESASTDAALPTAALPDAELLAASAPEPTDAEEAP
jgi:hypothetical protein